MVDLEIIHAMVIAVGGWLGLDSTFHLINDNMSTEYLIKGLASVILLFVSNLL